MASLAGSAPILRGHVTTIVFTHMRHAHKYLVRDSCSMLLISVRNNIEALSYRRFIWTLWHHSGSLVAPLTFAPFRSYYNLIWRFFLFLSLFLSPFFPLFTLIVLRYLCLCLTKGIQFNCTPAEHKIIEATNTKHHLYQLSCHCKSLRFAEAHQPSIFETSAALLSIRIAPRLYIVYIAMSSAGGRSGPMRREKKTERKNGSESK